MSETSFGFRTAVGGFHKGDVSAYISKTAAEHSAKVSALQARIDELEAENERLRKNLLCKPSELVQVIENLPDPEPEPEPAPPTMHDQELNAYRRAEAAERLACQRAKKLYGEMQQICDRSARQVEETDAAAQTAISAIQAQLDAICASVTSLYESVRTSSEELRAIGQLVPDPAEGLEEV